METKHQDHITFYKNLEKECNKRIHDFTNCLAFTCGVGKALEHHLDSVMLHRKIINNRLKRLNVPNKDEFAAIAVRMVDCEEKLDDLEEIIYLLGKKQKENYRNLKILRGLLQDLHLAVELEVRDFQVCKIKSLEHELDDLKQLFDELSMGE